MSTPFRKQVYTQASADYKDFEGFLDEMERALRPLGIYCVHDPELIGSDMHGVIFHQGPIDPKKLWAWLRKQNPVFFKGDRFTKAVEQGLTPSAFYKAGDTVKIKIPGFRASKPQAIIGADYYVKWGWCYTIPDSRGPNGVVEVEEKYLVSVQSNSSTTYPR